jgi:hypothetical protein
MQGQAGLIFAGKAALIAATLALVLLPAGQLPRIAGPCGKALCECPADVQTHSACKAQDHSEDAPKQVLTFGPSMFSSEAPGWVLQDVFSGLLVPQTINIDLQEINQPDSIAVSKFSTLPSHPAEVSEPPPRA